MCQRKISACLQISCLYSVFKDSKWFMQNLSENIDK